MDNIIYTGEFAFFRLMQVAGVRSTGIKEHAIKIAVWFHIRTQEWEDLNYQTRLKSTFSMPQGWCGFLSTLWDIFHTILQE